MVLVIGKDSLAEDELVFVHEIFMNPGSHMEHSVDDHKRLSESYHRCILCLLGSKVA